MTLQELGPAFSSAPEIVAGLAVSSRKAELEVNSSLLVIKFLIYAVPFSPIFKTIC